MASLYDLVRFSTSTTGTGTVTVGTATSGFMTPATLPTPIPDGTVVTYSLRDGSASEMGRGTVGSSATTISRDTVLASTNSGAKISLSGSAEMFITAAGQDFVHQSGTSFTATEQAQARSNIYAASTDALAYNNIPINPFHNISQENGTTSVSVSNTTKYISDQWQVAFVGTSLAGTGQVVSAPFTSYPAILYGLQLTTTTAKASLSAGDYIFASQPIEGQRVAKLGWGTSQAQAISIGKLMRSSIALTGYISVRNGATNRSYLKQFTLAANTDTYVSIIIPGDTSGTWATDNTLGLTVTFCFGAGSTYQSTANAWQAGNYMAASDVTNLGATNGNNVIGSGLVVLPALSSSIADAPGIADLVRFRRHPHDELSTCQRYFCKSYSYGVALGTVTWAGNIRNVVTAGAGVFNFDFPTEMRTVPTVTGYSPNSGTAGKAYSASDGDVNITISEPSTRRACLAAAFATSGTYSYLHWSANSKM